MIIITHMCVYIHTHMSRYFLNIGCALRCDIIGTSSLKKDMFLCFWPFAHQCLSMGIPRNFGTRYLHVLVAPFHARLLDEFIPWYPTRDLHILVAFKNLILCYKPPFFGGGGANMCFMWNFFVIIHVFHKRWSTDWRADSYHLVIKGGWKIPIEWRFFIGTSFTLYIYIIMPLVI